MPHRRWTDSDVGDGSGRTVVVTGANSGLGAATAARLARAGARVIIACRDTSKGEAAKARMRGDVIVRPLDLSDLASIRAFAASVDEVDTLINNAGVMAPPKGLTKDGFELQIGTNHLGHFALTGLLIDRIRDRVVTLSSTAHRMGVIDLDDLNWERRKYRRWAAYGQSKLANLMFTYELARRLRAAGSPVRSVAAHPGYAATNLQSHTESRQDLLLSIGNRLFAQSAEMGALPTLYAATTPGIVTGTFIGPDGLFESRGYPEIVESNERSHDAATATGLWLMSEELTGVHYLD